jgi:hypothetical protein
MLDKRKIEEIAHLLAGDAPGWQTRFGTMTGLSRGHVSNLLSGTRPVTQVVAVKIIEAAQREARDLRARAEQLDGVLAMVMGGIGTAIPPIDDED